MPLVVIANAADAEYREISYERGLAFAREIGAIGFYECSALMGVNVKAAIERPLNILFNHKFFPDHNSEKEIDETNRSVLAINTPIRMLEPLSYPKEYLHSPVLNIKSWQEILEEINSNRENRWEAFPYNLKHYHIGSIGLEQFVNGLKNNHILSMLTLGYNEFGSDGSCLY